MDNGVISTRYAKALLAYTEQSGVSDAVYGQVKLLAENLGRVPRLRQVLANPILGRSDKLTLLGSAVGGAPTRELERFFELVLTGRREELLQGMALMYIDFYRKARNINRGHLETAAELPDQTIERMKEWMRGATGGEAELETTVNPDLIGGFIFRLNFRQIDASVSSQLSALRKHFTEENRQAI
jgi:F-type H+-transporting ATPase subunit delta